MENKDELLEKTLLELDDYKLKLKQRDEEINYLRKQLYGAKSEKTVNVDPDQLSFFNEAEGLENKHVSEPRLEIDVPSHKRKQAKSKDRVIDISNLPSEDIHYELPQDKLACPECDGTLHDIGRTDVRQELKFIPARMVVVNHNTHNYACRKCERENTKTPFLKAKAPVAAIPKSIASPSLIANVISDKYSNGMPFYRQEKNFKNLGVPISRQNMANWTMRAAEDWFQLIFERMHQHLLELDIIHADETPVQVLRENGREAKSKSYMWMYRSGRTDVPIILYEYQPSRAGECPKNFLEGATGYLQTDGYQAYNSVDNVTRVGCMAHARRKFVDAVEAAGKETTTKSKAYKGFRFCNLLFKIQRKIEELDSEATNYNERLIILKFRRTVVINLFRQWLDYMSQVALMKSKLGEAVKYTLNQWDSLIRYCEDDRLEISNNLAERSIKPFVIGRKAWLFSNTPKGAKASAITYSIVETAKENGLIPFEYIKFLLETVPSMEITSENIDQLLPWSKSLPVECFTPKKGESTPNQ